MLYSDKKKYKFCKKSHLRMLFLPFRITMHDHPSSSVLLVDSQSLTSFPRRLTDQESTMIDIISLEAPKNS